jgi:hypothetical protein
MGTERYKHQFAKTVLAQWFREVSAEKDSSARLRRYCVSDADLANGVAIA